MINETIVKEIIDKTDIVSLVSEYVTLTKKGSGYFGLCPFHDDSSPSFSVSPDKKIAKCMSCKAGGNPITFLMQIENISYQEAVVSLAKRTNVKIDESLATKKVDKNQKYYDIFQVTQEFYTYNLFNTADGKKALDYLHKRGLDDDTIKMFRIGLAPKKYDTLTNVLMDKGFVDLDCISLGLIKNNGVKNYDFFTNRIMFPVTNEYGKIIAFSGRLFDESDGPKYVNSPETVIYRKGDHLYNLSNAIKQSRRTNRLILCEGQMDAIKISSTGLTDVTCALGSALTTNQISLLKKYANEIVLIYDNDRAGIEASIKAIENLKNVKVSVVKLPDGLDPDEYININGAENFKNLVSNAVDSIEFVYSTFFLNKDLNSLSETEEIKNNVFKYLRTIKSKIIEEKMLNRLAHDISINLKTIESDYYTNYNTANTNKFVETKQQSNNNYNHNLQSYYEQNVPPEPVEHNYYVPPIHNEYVSPTPSDFLNNNTLGKPNKIERVFFSSKKMKDALNNLLALIILDRNSISTISDLYENSAVESFLPKKYQEIYIALMFILNNYGYDIAIDECINHLRLEIDDEEIFDSIETIINNLINKMKYQNILKASLFTIEIEYLSKKIKQKKGIVQQNLHDEVLLDEITNDQKRIDELFIIIKKIESGS